LLALRRLCDGKAESPTLAKRLKCAGFVASEASVPPLPSRMRGMSGPLCPRIDEAEVSEPQRRQSEIRRSFDAKAFMPRRTSEITRRYDIAENEIGSGGYGKVFVAEDREVRGRQVAIKKVVVFDEDKKAAFLKEVSIMKELDHPNICKLLETYEQGRFMFFVMEYCEGKEVFDRIMDRGMIAEHTTADIVRQVTSALRYAHTRNIAHRDMKPENICFCSKDVTNNHVKVIDWGLGFYFGQARMSSAVGSLTYAAPEVLEQRGIEGYTAACDLWSLGVVTYVMLCGKPPFWGAYNEQLKRMKKETYPMGDATWRAISQDAKDLIKALLRNDPRRRLSLDAVMQHPWLRARSDMATMDQALATEVLNNMRQFSNTSQFISMCVASVARQLDHRSLRDVHRVFSEMDTNGDGVLELQEVKNGFEKIFGAGHEQLKDIEAMFHRLDLDGSGTIDYTEFCAAGIGERVRTEEHVLWAAFKAFDVNDDDGRISKDEITKVLSSADVNKLWTQEVCEDVAKEIVERFDENGDGCLDFQEWLRLMRESASRRKAEELNLDVAQSTEERELLAELERTLHQEQGLRSFDRAYGILAELEKKAGSRPDSELQKSPAARAVDADGKGVALATPVARASAPAQASRQTSCVDGLSPQQCFGCAIDARARYCSLM